MADLHEQFESDFSDHYEGTLPLDRRAEVDAHLETCERCRTEYARFRETMGAISGLGRVAAPENLGGKVAETIRKRSAGRFFGRSAVGDRVPFELIAAIALIALLLAYFFFIRWRI